LSRTVNTVVFSHGKESGPWGAKITAMAAMDDAAQRVEKLLAVGCEFQGPIALVGSSMGGHVAAAAASHLDAAALFLLAPAFYMPGFEKYTPQNVTVPTAIVHGWNDEVVPVDNSIRWAREHRATLHLLDSDHRLEDQIGVICTLLRDFLIAL